MKDLSLHILDLAMNSIRAGADTIRIDLRSDEDGRWLYLKISDNGSGIPEDLIKTAGHIPFTTKEAEETAVFGHGLYDFCNQAVSSGGTFDIAAPPEGGTVIEASLCTDNGIEPGNISDTIYALWTSTQDVRIIFSYQDETGHFELDTR